MEVGAELGEVVVRERIGLGLEPADNVLECAVVGSVGLLGHWGDGGAFAGGEGVVEIDAYRSCIKGGVVWWEEVCPWERCWVWEGGYYDGRKG